MSDHENPILPKGGRGKKAPYKTQTVRVPVDVMETVEAIANHYRTTGEVLELPIQKSTIDYSKAIEIVEEIKTTKAGKTKSAQEAMIKLVTGLFGDIN